MPKTSTKDRMKSYRQRLRKEGLRPVQVWTIDKKKPEFKEELVRQVANLNQDAESEELQFWEKAVDWPKE
jgi:DNA-binding LacI/PurR family transcriptional regulator